MTHRRSSRIESDNPPGGGFARASCPVVVGVGASAGGLEAFVQLLSGLPADPGLAIVFVQHLSPQHASALPALLSGATALPVVEAADGMPLEANRVYVIPPNAFLRISGLSLRLLPRPDDLSQYSPIDLFLRSLAEELQSKAIGVILSGMARDGTLGVGEVKAAGGVTLAQTPETARFDGMPRSAIDSQAIDLVLPPEAMGEELVRIARHPLLWQAANAEISAAPVTESEMQRLFALLRQSSGVDFAQYKSPTIRRRLERRMALAKAATLEEYLAVLAADAAEVERLFHDVLIHVTHFFREPESFEALNRLVIGELLEGGEEARSLRIWIPGCSSGEEAYSLAMLLTEELYKRSSGAWVHIFATDLSERAIERARAGVYSPSIIQDVGERRLLRFFSKSDGAYRVSRQLRDMCVFAKHDLLRDPPFSRLDLIMCRNLLIYLGAAAQKKLMHAFHYALKPNGFLMLGSAETIGPRGELFSVVDAPHRLYRRNPIEATAPFEFVAPHYSAESSARLPPRVELRGADYVRARAHRLLLDRFAPPGVIVDARGEVLEFLGQTQRYVTPAPGEPSFNLLRMAREGLVHALRTALRDAVKSGAAIRHEGLRFEADSSIAAVNIDVVPLSDPAEPPHFLVMFQEVAAPAPAVSGKSQGGAKAGRRLVQLEQELKHNRVYLQSIIHDLEAANEELQSANEEILSSNEELQSANEELDAAREELQSTNEELNTVNDDLHGRNEELARVNSDLMNLLSSVQIAIVIVSSDLRVRRFTPKAERAFNLIPADIGRSIAQINPAIDCPDLQQLIEQVVAEATVSQRDVRDKDGRRHSLTIRPYRTVDNRIDGAVLSLFEVEPEQR